MRSDLKTFYNQTDHQVDIESADFASVMAYLRSHGLPDPQVLSQEVGTPTGIRYTDIELIYTDAMRAPLMMQAFLVMNRPQGAVVDYRLWKGESNVTIPAEYAPPEDSTEPEVPVKVPAKPGPVMRGNLYYPLAGDDSPHGTRWSDGNASFVKRVIRTPFGNSVYWEKTS